MHRIALVECCFYRCILLNRSIMLRYQVKMSNSVNLSVGDLAMQGVSVIFLVSLVLFVFVSMWPVHSHWSRKAMRGIISRYNNFRAYLLNSSCP